MNRATGLTDRIPTLDGWRGIAILIVVFVHAQLGIFGHFFESLYIGGHGVTIFFVLSGFLITSRLLSKDGGDLKAFYLRRFFRLMPCAWIYLVCLVTLGMVFNRQFTGPDFWSSLFFCRNYFPRVDTNSTVLTDQFWSLSLEEQFYLLWPALLLLLGKRKSFYVAVIGITACAFYRDLNWSTYQAPGFEIRSEVNIDGPLTGCILALSLKSKTVRMWFSRNGSWLLWISLAVIVWFMTRPQPLIQVTEKFAIAIAIGCTSLNSGHLFARFLEWRPLKFIGVISYSVYVWQELFLVVPSHGIGLLLLPAFSILSWHYIERPGIEFGREFIARYTRRGGSSISLPVGVAEQNHGVECVSP